MARATSRILLGAQCGYIANQIPDTRPYLYQTLTDTYAAGSDIL